MSEDHATGQFGAGVAEDVQAHPDDWGQPQFETGPNVLDRPVEPVSVCYCGMCFTPGCGGFSEELGASDTVVTRKG